MMKIVVVLFNGIMTSDKSAIMRVFIFFLFVEKGAIMSWVNNVSYKIHCVAYIC